jgi:hypothetical protein
MFAMGRRRRQLMWSSAARQQENSGRPLGYTLIATGKFRSCKRSGHHHTYHRLILGHSCSYAAGTSGNAGTTRSSGMIGLHWQVLWQRARRKQTCGESVYREKIGRQQMLGALSLLPQCKPELILSLNRVLLCISNIWPRGPLKSI